LQACLDGPINFNAIFCFLFALQLDNYEIRSGKRLKVNISIAKVRLFVGNIPKQRSKEEIMAEFTKMSGDEKDFAKLNHFSVFVIVLILQFIDIRNYRFHEPILLINCMPFTENPGKLIFVDKFMK